MLFDTVERALSDAGLSAEARRGMPLFIGSTALDMPLEEGRYRRHVQSADEPPFPIALDRDRVASTVADRFGLRGPRYTFHTACTAGANALLAAVHILRAARAERALVVGVEIFNQLTLLGFESLGLLTADVYRPLDRRRSGIILGEGIGALVLGRRSGGRHGGGCRLLGGAVGCDTDGLTTNAADGAAIARTLRAALADGGAAPQAVAGVKLHATGSGPNDLAECRGLKTVFGLKLPPVTGLKPYIGHTLGACGVNELILFSEALQEGVMPATPGFEMPDPELGVVPLTTGQPVGPGIFLLNFFGFGGNCNALVVANG